jgi:hypothetical protein
MVTLFQRRFRIKFSEPRWDELLALAQQAGWRPAGAIDIQRGTPAPDYGPGQLVFPSDARELSAALERVVNSDKADDANLDLAAMVRVINFLRLGAFEIR